MAYLSGHEVEPTIVVVFGASGDLTWRKLVPALFSLSGDACLPPRFAVIGVDRLEQPVDAWRERLKDGTRRFSSRRDDVPELWDGFAQAFQYMVADFANPT